jgi:platelet-activating factor acetylhydrolase
MPSWVRRYTRRKEGVLRKEFPEIHEAMCSKDWKIWSLATKSGCNVAPTKEELLRHGVQPNKGLETDQSDGMVEVTGQEGNSRSDHRGIEERYLERG